MGGRRLRDVLWDHSRLYLIMDYLDVDLREHLDTDPCARDLANVKVSVNRLAGALIRCLFITLSHVFIRCVASTA